MLTLVLLGPLLLHGGALRLPFFADDYIFLEHVRGRSLIAALVGPDPIGNFFRPVGRQLYFWLLGRVSGESPAAFHAANLALFLGILAVLFLVVRRLAGPLAAAAAAAMVALHYAADVPLRWVSGSQDLLAVLGALGAIALHQAGRSRWAAPPLLAGLLSKETVLLTPFIAAAVARRPGERWGAAFLRAWPLGAAVAAWAALWLGTAPQRRALGASLGIEPLGALAVLAHLPHVIAGLEWRGALTAMGSAVPPLLPLVPTVLALLLAGPTRGGERQDLRPALAAAGVWMLAAATPLVAVAAIWSAYYYLFALCGAALAIGVLLARAPRWAAIAVVAALAAGSQAGRTSPEFATGRGAWTWQSHINRLYVDRATEGISRYLADLKRARPAVPPRSTFFFGGVPAFMSWQAADGPLVRWAYRDTSLRSYYQSDFTHARARRGPVFFFVVAGDTLREEPAEPPILRGIALRVLLNERLDTARELLAWLEERERPPAPDVLYFRAWLEWERGDTLAAMTLLQRAGVVPARGGSREVERAAARLAAGDSAAAAALVAEIVTRHGLEAQGHALMADLRLRLEPRDSQARIEALAARVLAPEDAQAWVRWGAIQGFDGRHSQAVRSLERGLALGLPDARQAAEVRAVLSELRRMVPGGELAQQELRRGLRRGAAPEGGAPGGGR